MRTRRPLLRNLLAWCVAVGVCACVGPARAEMTCDEYIAALREGRPPGILATASTPGWDNDAVIDALADILIHGAGPRPRSSRYSATNMLAYHRGLQISGRAVDARGLDYMLPARVAPALLRALDRAEPQSGDQYRRNLLIALGSIDHPTQATLDAVRKRLDDDDPWTALGAVKAAGMLGRHAAEAADTLASMLDSSAPGRWHWEKGGNRWLWLDDQGEIAVALARVSEGARGRALDALLRSARDDEPRSAARAVEHLRDLGTRARPAVEDLMSMLREGNAAQPTVTEAVLSISPELFPDVVSLLVGRATSYDLQGAWVADRELLSLNSERAESPEMRAAAPALIAALERRLPSDGLQLSKVVRRLDTGEAHAAYDAYRSRERRERGVRE